MKHSYRHAAARGGASTIMTIGAVLIGLGASAFAIDLPYYFNVRNQMQTALDAAVLAGAAFLPLGQQQAQQAAYQLISQNVVAGGILPPNSLSYSSSQSTFTVTSQLQVPTIMGNFLCSLAGQLQGRNPNQPNTSPTRNAGAATCGAMTVVASSTAAPAARDTILVIDTSSSMNSLGNGHPLVDVQKAADNYINTIVTLNNGAVDRIGLVHFDENSVLLNHLTSQQDSPQYAAVTKNVNSLTLYNGPSWNTNYEAGLQAALDELATNGRPNAQQRVIFMTDGMPNQPAPPSYYQYSQAYPYNECIDMVNNSPTVKALCTRNSQHQLVCPVLPNPQIKPNMIPASAVQCATTYINNLTTVTDAQVNRAKTMGVTIDTIVINNPNYQDSATQILQAMVPSWQPMSIANYMNQTTSGESYYAMAYDATTINAIYAQIAQNIHIKLTN